MDFIYNEEIETAILETIHDLLESGELDYSLIPNPFEQ